jgi:glycosyl transferase, family 25
LTIPAAITEYLHNYFDRIVVISVPRFAHRHKIIQENLKGLSFDFFWGTDKLEINIDTVKKDGTYDESKAIQLQRQGKSLNIGEIACALSHRMVYNEMIRQQWQKVLILEDDVLPLFNNLPIISTAIMELPDNWELVYFGYLKNEKITPGAKLKQFIYGLEAPLGLIKWNYNMVNHLLPIPYSPHLKIAGFHDCTHAYGITLEAAKKLASIQTPLVYRADDLLSSTIMKGEIKAFITVPKFFDQETFHNPAILSEIKEC